MRAAVKPLESMTWLACLSVVVNDVDAGEDIAVVVAGGLQTTMADQVATRKRGLVGEA